MAKKSSQPSQKEPESEETEHLDSIATQEPKTEIATQKSTSNINLLSEIEGVDLATLDAIDKASSENIQAGEVQFSRIAIAQPTTPEVAGQEEGWQAGMFFDNISREILSIYGKEPWLLNKGIPATDLKGKNYLQFVPIFKLPSEYCLWPTKEERAAGQKIFHWKSLDPTEHRVREGLWAPKGTWKGEGSPPVTEHINILGICLARTGEISSNYIIASFSRTAFPTGKKLVTQIQNQRFNKLKYWDRVYYLYNNFTKRDGNTFCVPDFAKGEQLDKFYEANAEETSMWQSMYKATWKHCYDIARSLADPENGVAMQHGILNAAAFGDEMDNAVDATAEASEGATEDPNF